MSENDLAFYEPPESKQPTGHTRFIFASNRELRRVALDFDAPLNVRWEGTRRPDFGERNCDQCDESLGYSPRAAFWRHAWYGFEGTPPYDPALSNSEPWQPDDPFIVANIEAKIERSGGCFYGTGKVAVQREAERMCEIWNRGLSHHLDQADVDALVEAGRLMDFTRRPINEEQVKALKEEGGYWMKESNGYRPTAREVNQWSLFGMGHDSTNCYIVGKSRCAREGVPDTCDTCKGAGIIYPSEEVRKQCDEWMIPMPPEGPGYQLWETCSEGSPITPVFETLEEVAAYATEHCSIFGSAKLTEADWLERLKGDESA